MRRRHLNLEERQLWESVAKTAKPITGRKAFHAETPPEPLRAAPKLPPAKPRIDPFSLGERSPGPPSRLDLQRSLSQSIADQPLNMDAKTHVRMTKGKLMPDARLDLHGMTLTEAHSELISFVLNAQSQGHRLVLVITGKGKIAHDNGAVPQRIGALRHQLPHWLRLPPLGAVVQQLAQAHLRHGGSGAYYVYLRRK